ncbi:MAG: protoporphyrinogen oxidase, partial [Parachlamydiales bacterium]|nr:protoporphyrinogen oxidase [Parachlamydiales bacterium]
MRVAVLGAGIAGLSLAYYLQRKGLNVTLIDQADRVGGWIQTEKDLGYHFENGPHSYRPTPLLEKLIIELNIQDQVLLPDPLAKNKFIYYRNRLNKPGINPFSSFQRPIFKALLKEWKQPNFENEETVHDFFLRRFGHDIASNVISALCAGIWGCHPKELSMEAAFPKWHKWEKDFGSITKALFKKPKVKKSSFLNASSFTFKKGMDVLPKALLHSFKGDLRLKFPIHKLDFYNRFVKINDAETFDRVYSTLPADALSNTIQDQSIAQLLNEFKSSTLDVVQLVYSDDVLKKKGFGYLVPFDQGISILGVIFDSAIFPEQNYEQETRLTVMMHPNENPLETATNAIKQQLNIIDTPLMYKMRHCRNAIGKYSMGHIKRVRDLENKIASLSTSLKVIGSSFYGPAISDCIEKSFQ